jgi:Zn-dependent protease
MRTSFTVAHIWGIPIRIHLNWLITAVLVTWSLSAGYFPLEYPGWTTAMYWMIGSLTSFLFFASVLLHELGHARLSQMDGVPVQSITLFLFGGVAHIAHEPESPGSEFRIVAAGPATSLGLAALFFILARTGYLSYELSAVAVYLTRINLILAIFNLIPGFPLDGGRLLRAFLWKVTQNYQRATRWATNAGMGIAGLFMLGGFVFMALGNWVGGLWVIFIGGYLGMVAHSAARSVLEEVEPDEEDELPAVQDWGFTGRQRDLSPVRRIVALRVVPPERLAPPWAALDEPGKPAEILRQAAGGTTLSFVPVPLDEPRKKRGQ